MAPYTFEHTAASRSLSTRLVAAMGAVVVLVGLAVYLPSIAAYRTGWLEDRLRVGAVAARVLDSVPDLGAVPPDMAARLLDSAGAQALVYRRSGQSHLIALPDFAPPETLLAVDLRRVNLGTAILGALDTLWNGEGRMLRIVGVADTAADAVVETVLPESGLRRAMLSFSGTILALGALVALVAGAAVLVLVRVLLIAPIRRMGASMVAFREAPENATLILMPSGRTDEIGAAERELAAMQADLFATLRQQRHLADLGLAVAKINHDLRNTLASAQLLSDQVANLDDPQVQRLAPRLVNTLDKAIGFAQAVLDHGRQNVALPRPQTRPLIGLIEDAAFDAGLAGHPGVTFALDVPRDLLVRVDPDQMVRVLANLLRNAREALELADMADRRVAVAFARLEQGFAITIADNGPGLTPRAREKLFVAFEGSGRAGGTGLGLVIARELVEAHGGTLRLEEATQGTRFAIMLPESALA